ncbi:hypothetical protein GOV05_01805 [Candidatus Woesearchaeota archaeon]|nr:hypothetical protein [Candidatus Woesearchaeota archaeon]
MKGGIGAKVAGLVAGVGLLGLVNTSYAESPKNEIKSGGNRNGYTMTLHFEGSNNKVSKKDRDFCDYVSEQTGIPSSYEVFNTRYFSPEELKAYTEEFGFGKEGFPSLVIYHDNNIIFIAKSRNPKLQDSWVILIEQYLK